MSGLCTRSATTCESWPERAHRKVPIGVGEASTTRSTGSWPPSPRHGLSGEPRTVVLRRQSGPTGRFRPTLLASAGTVCGQYGPDSSQCKGAEQIQAQVASEESAGQAVANKPIIDVAGAVGSFVTSHAAEIGIGLGLAAIALTGVGLIAELAPISALVVGAGAFAAGTAATALDYRPCVNQHDSLACLGLIFGATGTAFSGFGVVIDAELLSGLGLNFAGAGATLDLAGTLVGGSGTSVNSSKCPK